MSTKRIGEGTTVAPTDWWKALPRKTFSELQRLQSSQPWFEVYKINPDVYCSMSLASLSKSYHT
jgi:hypothetical protein